MKAKAYTVIARKDLPDIVKMATLRSIVLTDKSVEDALREVAPQPKESRTIQLLTSKCGTFQVRVEIDPNGKTVMQKICPQDPQDPQPKRK